MFLKCEIITFIWHLRQFILRNVSKVLMDLYLLGPKFGRIKVKTILLLVLVSLWCILRFYINY